MCLLTHPCVREGIRQTEIKIERACRLRREREMCFFRSIVNVQPPIDIQRSLIKSESRWGVVGY